MNRERASQLRSGTFYQPQDSRTQAPSDTPDEGPAAQNGLEPGALYEYQGGNWRYRGGDPADPQSWEQE